MQVVSNANKVKEIEDISAGEVFKIRNDYFLKIVSFEDSNCNIVTCVGLADGIAYAFSENIEAEIVSGKFVED